MPGTPRLPRIVMSRCGALTRGGPVSPSPSRRRSLAATLALALVALVLAVVTPGQGAGAASGVRTLAGRALDFGCANPANRGSSTLLPAARTASRSGVTCFGKVISPGKKGPLTTTGPGGARAGADPVGVQAGRAEVAAGAPSPSSTPTTTRRPSPTSPSTARPTACPPAPPRTAASRRSTRTARPARCRPVTTAGPRRSASTSTPSRPPAPTATSCSSRPARPTTRR